MNDSVSAPYHRYVRQTVLPEIGHHGQQKLANASVLCIGAGGLGCPVLLYLAAAGIGRIGIVDDDVVDETNLQRQILFINEDVGLPKAVVAREKLLAMNPTIDVVAYHERLTDANCADLFTQYDIVVDGTDNFSSKFLINDAGVKYGIPVVYGAILGFSGQASVFNAPLLNTPKGHDNEPYNHNQQVHTQRGACYRCLYPEPPQGHIPNCAEAGVIGAVAGMVGTVQALQVIQYCVGHQDFESLAGRLWLMDMKTMQNKILTVPKNPTCTVCGGNPNDIILQYSAPVCGVVPTLSVSDLKDIHNRVTIIDVRELNEWDTGHIDGAIHHPLSHLLEGKIPPINKNIDIVVHCQKQPRSEQATAILKRHGFTKIRILKGGFEAWTQDKKNNP